MSPLRERILIAVPAYNEAPTIADVVGRVRMPQADLLVVNDGSGDATGVTLGRLGVLTATHLCNLGYGRAIQTAIKYAIVNDYDVLVTLDADGQHRPSEVREAVDAFCNSNYDVLIGSRHARTGSYGYAPPGRRLGMQVFSILTRLMSGQRVYDTTSGLKILNRRVFVALTQWHFVDFHAEAIVYLLRLGFRVGEPPITVDARTQRSVDVLKPQLRDLPTDDVYDGRAGHGRGRNHARQAAVTVQGSIVVNLIALGLTLWVLNLVRRGRLYVGYGVMFVVAAAVAIVIVSVPGLLGFVAGVVGAVSPVSALTFIALTFIVFLFVYVLSQLTIIANRFVDCRSGTGNSACHGRARASDVR